jgi:glutaredoxin-like protein NrdH
MESEQTMTITVWEAPGCAQCSMVKKRFDKEDIEYQIKDLSDPKNIAQLERFRDQGYAQAPIVQTPNDTFAGYNPAKLEQAVTQARSTQAQTTGAEFSGPSVT